ncbi:hypothetical protein E5D57_010786 [Metarhizium anisopliae]|nr:hypothetical protein E5D57_010786 [Metarhizium anisopliae]
MHKPPPQIATACSPPGNVSESITITITITITIIIIITIIITIIIHWPGSGGDGKKARRQSLQRPLRISTRTIVSYFHIHMQQEKKGERKRRGDQAASGPDLRLRQAAPIQTDRL